MYTCVKDTFVKYRPFHRITIPSQAPLYSTYGRTPGRNRVRRADGSMKELPGKAAVDVRPGDELIIETPGGGGFGAPAV